MGAGSSPMSDSPMVADCSFALVAVEPTAVSWWCSIELLFYSGVGVEAQNQPPFLQLTEDTDAHLYRVDKET